MEITYELKVSVFDFNGFRPHVLIGSASVSMEHLMYDLEKETELSMAIHNDKGAKSGHVTIHCLLERTILARVSRISCRDLTNVEVMGHNDPFVRLDFGYWSEKTEPRDNAGAMAEWSNLDFAFETTNRILRAECLKIQVFDHYDTL